jgi:ferredoxin
MAHTITDDCINCGACAPECPQEAISEGAEKYTVDAAKCDDCGSCVEVCPTGATLQA